MSYHIDYKRINWLRKPRNLKLILTIQLSVILILIIIMTNCFKKPQEPIRIGISPWPGYEPMFLAREKGYFSEKDVKLIDYTSVTGQSRAFVNGAVDAAAMTLDVATKLRESGVDLRIVLVFDVSNGGDVILANPVYQTLKDLKNKKIGVETTSIGDYMISRALELSGMKLTDIKVVPLEISEHERAFKEKRVDAIVTYEPVKTKLIAYGANKIFDSSQIPGEIVDVLVVRTDYLKKGDKQLISLLNGWFKALGALTTDSLNSIRFMAAREQISDKEFILSLEGLTIPNMQSNIMQLGGANPGLLAPARHLERIMYEKKLIEGRVDLVKLFDASFIERLTK
ncbi:MAG: ABC transporter substrate-binding protein [Candidatus Kapabacteria bacterium]|nr:ABC transporter substrate-binding protein [Candidatus Kapabacteria bacterium]